jgi:hypothetical protein
MFTPYRGNVQVAVNAHYQGPISRCLFQRLCVARALLTPIAASNSSPAPCRCCGLLERRRNA